MDVPDLLDEPAPEQEAVAHRLSAKVEIAIAKTETLVDRRVGLVDVERRRLRLGQDGDIVSPELDVSGREIGVLLALYSPGHRSGDGDHELAPYMRRGLMCPRSLRGVEDDLGDPVSITDV